MISYKYIRFILAAAILTLIINAPTASAQKRRKFKFCKLDYLIECFNEPIAFFTSQYNGTGIASNEIEYEQYCFNNHDYLPYCVRKWIQKCGSEMHVELARRFFIIPMQQSMKEFCDSKGTIRPTFLAHSKCLIEKVKLSPDYRAQCVRPFQANNEYVHSLAKNNTNLGRYLHGFCCAFNQWEDCIVGFLRRECGEDSTTSIPYLIHHTTMNLLQLCSHSRYDPEDEAKCPPEVFRASKEYRPIGYGSPSLISHMFTYLCPNVGWGADPSRDF